MQQSKQIIDRFGRVHDYLRISLTERCNLRCTYCMPEEGIQLRDKNEFMSHEELLGIAQQFVHLGVRKIRLTGGEPLIKKNVEHIIEGLAKLPVELTITTNGILLDRYGELLKKSGVKKINISLDSLKGDRFTSLTRRNYFERVMKNIDYSIELGFDIKINVVLMKGTNEDEIIDFIKWSGEKGVQVRFIEFMPFDGNNWNWESKVSYQYIIEKAENHFGKDNLIKLEDEQNRTARNFKIKDSNCSFGIISSVTNPFCDTCNRIRLTADGKIKNCLFSENETNLLEAYRNGKDINELIYSSITNKEKERAGLPDFNQLEEQDIKNRSMVAIGG